MSESATPRQRKWGNLLSSSASGMHTVDRTSCWVLSSALSHWCREARLRALDAIFHGNWLFALTER